MLLTLLGLMPVPGLAQVSVVVGGSAAVPLGDFADVGVVGAQGVLGASLAVAGGAVVEARGFYGRNGHRIEGERSELYGVTVLGGYRMDVGGEVLVTPWVGLGGAVHAHKSEPYPGLEASRSGLTLDGGVAVSRAVGRVRVFGSAFYTRGLGELGGAFPTELVTLGAGLEFPIGSD